jgi:hypothetical protein
MSVVRSIIDPASISTIFANVAFFILFQCIFFYLVVSKKYEEELENKTQMIQPFLENSPYLGKLLCKKMKENAEKSQQKINGMYWLEISSVPKNTEFIEDDSLHGRLIAKRNEMAKWLEANRDKEWIHKYIGSANITIQLKIYNMDTTAEDTYKIDDIVKSGDKYFRCISIREMKDILNRNSLIRPITMFVCPCVILAIVLLVVANLQKKWGKHHTWAMILIAGCFSTELIFYISVMQGHMIVGDWQLLHNAFEKLV